RLDSVYAQEVNSQNWYHVRFYYRDQLGFTVEDWEPHTSIRIDSIPPNKTLYLRNFSVANILTKRAAESSALAEGDTLRVRLRFKSLGGEADTLMVVGILGGITPIRFTPYRPRTLEEGFVGRDILGRTVTSSARFPVLIRKILE